MAKKDLIMGLAPNTFLILLLIIIFALGGSLGWFKSEVNIDSSTQGLLLEQSKLEVV